MAPKANPNPNPNSNLNPRPIRVGLLLLFLLAAPTLLGHAARTRQIRILKEWDKKNSTAAAPVLNTTKVPSVEHYKGSSPISMDYAHEYDHERKGLKKAQNDLTITASSPLKQGSSFARNSGPQSRQSKDAAAKSPQTNQGCSCIL